MNIKDTLNSMWDPKQNLKENIVNIFKTDLNASPEPLKYNPNGFYNTGFKAHEMRKSAYLNAKTKILKKLGEEELTIENFHEYLRYDHYSVNNKSKELDDKIQFVLDKIWEDDEIKQVLERERREEERRPLHKEDELTLLRSP